MKQIKVKNLDTGEEMDLVEAEDQLPQSINPLSLHIMRLTSEYVSGDRSTMNRNDSDTESMVSSVSNYTLGMSVFSFIARFSRHFPRITRVFIIQRAYQVK